MSRSEVDIAGRLTAVMFRVWIYIGCDISLYRITVETEIAVPLS